MAFYSCDTASFVTRSLLPPPARAFLTPLRNRYHQRYPPSMMGSKVGGRGPGRRLVMPPGASIGPMGSSAHHGAKTSILDLDYSAKVHKRYSYRNESTFGFTRRIASGLVVVETEIECFFILFIRCSPPPSRGSRSPAVCVVVILHVRSWRTTGANCRFL